MEPAVTTQLAGVLGQVTGWDDLGDARAWRSFQASRKPVLWLQAVPTAGGISGSRRQLATANGMATPEAKKHGNSIAGAMHYRVSSFHIKWF